MRTVKNIINIDGSFIVIEIHGVGKTTNEYAPKSIKSYGKSRGIFSDLRESEIQTI